MSHNHGPGRPAELCLDGATAGIASRLDAFDANRARATTDDAQDV
jgi:hypothetical protein